MFPRLKCDLSCLHRFAVALGKILTNAGNIIVSTVPFVRDDVELVSILPLIVQRFARGTITPRPNRVRRPSSDYRRRSRTNPR
ncbi:hypothetical protein KM043_013162 [Ampulex compressa]|nr:hypothetical protein KM043_013162 [Ampulex compressa]